MVINKRLLVISLCFSSFFFQAFYLNFGYAIKLYMLFIPIIFLFYSNRKINTNFYNYEYFFLLTIYSFSFSSLYTYDLESSLKMVLGLILLVLFYIIFLSAIKSFSFEDIIFALIAAGIIFNFISLCLYFYGIKIVGGVFSFSTRGVYYGLLVDRGIPRLIGTLKDPNFFIAFNSLFLFVSYFNFKSGFWAKTLFLLSLVSMFCTFSIGGLIAIVCGVSSIAIQSKKGILRLASLLFCFVLLFFLAKEFFPQIDGFINSRTEGASDGSGRFEDWNNAFQTFLSYPFGIGIYSFLKFNLDVLGGSHYVHNTYLEVLVEGGVHTFIFYILSLFCLLYHVRRLGITNKKLEFLLPSSITLLVSFISLSGFASEYWIIYLGIVNFFISNEKTIHN